MVTKEQNKKILKVIEEKPKRYPIKDIQRQIAKVFLELEKQKVKCEQNFWCCQTCGCSAMNDYEDNLNYEGYCFFHNQDFDTLKIEGVTHLSYGSFREKTMEEIGDRIFKMFKKEGIKVTWNGNSNSRIMIDFN
jgi:hypothetical protein